MKIPKLDPTKSQYPNDEQMTTMFNAWKTGGEEGLRKALEARKKEQTDQSK